MSEIRIPDIGDVESVQVVELCVAPGDQVEPNDPLIVIESDKASMEVPAGIAGQIEELMVAEGDDVSAGSVIARIAPAESAQTDTANAPEPETATQATTKPESAEEPQKNTVAEAGASDSQPAVANSETPLDADQTHSPVEKTAETKSSTASPAVAPGKTAATAKQIDVVVPDVGEVESVTVIEVGAKVGDTLSADDLVVVVESDKASMEIPAGQGGKVLELHIAEGDTVKAGDRLITLQSTASPGAEDAEGAEVGSKEAAPQQPDTGDTSIPTSEVKEATEKEAKAESGLEETADQQTNRDAQPLSSSETQAADAASTNVYAGPAVRRLARELGVTLAQVKGTGSRGRIVKDDVQNYVKSQLSGGGVKATAGIPSLPVQDFSKFGPITEQPLGRVREVGAQNLHRSWLNVVHVTQHDEADVTEMEAFRQDLKAEAQQRQTKLTPLAFIIKACCYLLKEFPTFNSSLSPDGKQYILKQYYHIGLAVDTEQGLVVPVLRDADQKGIWELSAEIADLAERARNRKLTPGMLQGGSFSISSLGPMGGTAFTPIVNAPEVAILGISKMATKPQWTGTEFVPRNMLPLSLSYDHRAINGAEAGRFVTQLGILLGDIRRLML